MLRSAVGCVATLPAADTETAVFSRPLAGSAEIQLRSRESLNRDYWRYELERESALNRQRVKQFV
jgi:hypothetical protein